MAVPHIQTGTVKINGGYSALLVSEEALMGVMKSSALGRRHGEEDILKFSELQTVAVQSVIPPGPFGILTPDCYTKVMTWALKKMKDIPFLSERIKNPSGTAEFCELNRGVLYIRIILSREGACRARNPWTHSLE